MSRTFSRGGDRGSYARRALAAEHQAHAGHLRQLRQLYPEEQRQSAERACQLPRSRGAQFAFISASAQRFHAHGLYKLVCTIPALRLCLPRSDSLSPRRTFSNAFNSAALHFERCWRAGWVSFIASLVLACTGFVLMADSAVLPASRGNGRMRNGCKFVVAAF